MLKRIFAFVFATLLSLISWADAPGMGDPIVGKKVVLAQHTSPYKHITDVRLPLDQQGVVKLQKTIDQAFVAGQHGASLGVLEALRNANVGAEVLDQPHAERFRAMSIAEAKHRMTGVKESLQKGCPVDASYRLHHVDLLTELWGGAERHIETYASVRRQVNTAVTEYRDEPIEKTTERSERLGCSMG